MEKREAQKSLKIKNKILKKSKWVQKSDGRKGLNDMLKCECIFQGFKHMENTKNEYQERVGTIIKSFYYHLCTPRLGFIGKGRCITMFLVGIFTCLL